ncbi:hypothetical protein Rcae01_05280 [Novipirellula caenicola]|uniref:Uncharacterized protein n=1 Tax=Novipirellula caenicola TaxID=1536901 RepID=A0ABP9VXA7_9BACT
MPDCRLGRCTTAILGIFAPIERYVQDFRYPFDGGERNRSFVRKNILD